VSEKIVVYRTGMVSHDGGLTYHKPDPSDPKDAAWLERTNAALARSMQATDGAPIASSGHLKPAKGKGRE
jgi:hypothetical protein